MSKSKFHWVVLIFVGLWRILGTVVKILGRMGSMILGAVIFVAGLLLCFTIIGALLGIPMMIVGAMLFVRAFTTRKSRF